MQVCQIARAIAKLPPEALSDHELLVAISARHAGAMEEFFNRYEREVYRFILRTFKDEGLAEDITAETFCQLWRAAAGSFRGQSRVSTWVLAVARNLAISALRRRSEQAIDENEALRIEDVTDNPEVAAAKKERGTIVAHCLELLPPAHRQLIDFFYFQDRSIAEMAKLTGLPANTVKTRLFRARHLMRELLKRHAVEEFDTLDETNDAAWLRHGPCGLGWRASHQEEAYA
jgi:RNA polymerase sigma-70 factor (ECF subfamily)